MPIVGHAGLGPRRAGSVEAFGDDVLHCALDYTRGDFIVVVAQPLGGFSWFEIHSLPSPVTDPIEQFPNRRGKYDKAGIPPFTIYYAFSNRFFPPCYASFALTIDIVKSSNFHCIPTKRLISVMPAITRTRMLRPIMICLGFIGETATSLCRESDLKLDWQSLMN